MSFDEARYYLDKTRRKYILIRVTELVLSAAAVAFLVLCILQITPSSGLWNLFIAIGSGLIFFILRAIHLRIFQLTNSGVASYLNRHYPALEESADLILKEDEELTSIQQLQKTRSVQHLESLYPSIKLPGQIGRTLLLFSISIVGYMLVNYFAKTPSQSKTDTASSSSVIDDDRSASF
ncbi:MAG TPA: hypothetical protein VK589_05330, partial [Chryseolinea sp.]|nr:hypothetical protein [Chryseolinea sp.]